MELLKQDYSITGALILTLAILPNHYDIVDISIWSSSECWNLDCQGIPELLTVVNNYGESALIDAEVSQKRLSTDHPFLIKQEADLYYTDPKSNTLANEAWDDFSYLENLKVLLPRIIRNEHRVAFKYSSKDSGADPKFAKQY